MSVIPFSVSSRINMPANQWVVGLIEMHWNEWELLLHLLFHPIRHWFSRASPHTSAKVGILSFGLFLCCLFFPFSLASLPDLNFQDEKTWLESSGKRVKNPAVPPVAWELKTAATVSPSQDPNTFLVLKQCRVARFASKLIASGTVLDFILLFLGFVSCCWDSVWIYSWTQAVCALLTLTESFLGRIKPPQFVFVLSR